MNNVFLRGNLASDVKSNTAGQTTFAGFTLAVNKQTKDGQKRADFFRVKFAGKTAETIIKFFKKGKEIIVIGELTTEKWNDNQMTLVFGRFFEFCGGKKDDSSGGESNDGGNGGGEGLW